VLEAGPATVAELCAAAELAQPTVSGALTKLEASGLAARIGKKGRADLWRVRGEDEDDGPAAVAS
jgi:DNA-binding IclR family transcriptional regulator